MGLSEGLSSAVEILLTLVFWGSAPPVRGGTALPNTLLVLSHLCTLPAATEGCGFLHLECPQSFSQLHCHLVYKASLIPDIPQPDTLHWAAAATSPDVPPQWPGLSHVPTSLGLTRLEALQAEALLIFAALSTPSWLPCAL